MELRNARVLNTHQIVNELATVDESANYWLVRTNSGEFYDDFIFNGYIGISWNQVSIEQIQSIKDENDREQFIQNLPKLIPVKEDGTEINPATYTAYASQMIRFVKEIKIGDIVLVPNAGSKSFRVGYVISEIFDQSTKAVHLYPHTEEYLLTNNYNVSNYDKRYKVRWFGRFNKDEADAKIYRMTNTHHVVTDINEYKPFINRVLFDAYREGNEAHFTFQVKQESDISAIWYAQFTNNIIELASLFTEDSEKENIVIKSNVQSHGIIEIIIGVSAVGLVSTLLYAAFNAKTKLKMKFKADTHSVSATIEKNSERLELSSIEMDSRKMTIEEIKAQDEHVAKKIENIDKATAVAQKIKDASSKIDGQAPLDLLNLVSKIAEVDFASDSIEDDENGNE